MSDKNKKWSCAYCTYENYPSDIKCKMCNIYPLSGELGGDELEKKTPFVAGALVEKIENIAYLKGPQCENTSNYVDSVAGIRSESPPTALSPHEHIQPLRISENSDLAQCFSRNSSPTSSLFISENRSRTSQTIWKCHICTYENWPNSSKCAMCGTMNNQTPNAIIEDYIDQIDISSLNNLETERTQTQMEGNKDSKWLDACLGVVKGDPKPVEVYLSSGGNPARTLTASECTLLDRKSDFDVGHTLVHLAMKFEREDLLAVLLSQIEGSTGSAIKMVPSYVASDLAAEIRKHFASSMIQGKGTFPCHYVTEFPTFVLPAEVDSLPLAVQKQLMAELLDKNVQEELEAGDVAAINWAHGAGVCRLHALWNRSAGDCLLDSVMQATWGVFDRENTLRRALADTLVQARQAFYIRWKEYESSHASFLQYSLEEAQWQEDWSSLVTAAAQPGSSLEQLHIFALAHVLRRPIIVYGVKVIKNLRGEALCPARFEGVYLPLLWDHSFCSRCPIAVSFTRDHFTALVPMEPSSNTQPRASLLPLVDKDRKPLQIHFLLESELGREETILRQWIEVSDTEEGIKVAQQPLHEKPLLMAQMCEEWLNHYRRIVPKSSAPATTPNLSPVPFQDYSSEYDTDSE